MPVVAEALQAEFAALCIINQSSRSTSELLVVLDAHERAIRLKTSFPIDVVEEALTPLLVQTAHLLTILFKNVAAKRCYSPLRVQLARTVGVLRLK